VRTEETKKLTNEDSDTMELK